MTTKSGSGWWRGSKRRATTLAETAPRRARLMPT